MNRIFALIASFLLTLGCLCSITANAAEYGNISDVNVSENKVSAYITAPSSPTSAQLGTYHCEILSVTPVGELPSDTLILVDTSGSIPADIRQKTKDLIMELIDQKQENERYSIASFGTEINVLCDYTSDRYDLAKALEGLDYSEKYTYVYSVLDKVLDNDKDDFYRIVMISDGVENSRDGITYDEILNKISSGHCPVYTVGIENGNQESLKKLYSFSRNSYAESAALTNESDISQICDTVNSSRNFICVEVSVPDEAADGSVRYLKISGQDYECGADVRIPAKEAVTTSAVTEIESVTTGISETEPQQNMTDLNSGSEKQGHSILPLIVSVSAVIAAIVVLIKKPWKKNKNTFSENDSNKNDAVTRQDVIKDDDVMIMLTDVDSPQRSYRCAVGNGITIGRDSSQCTVALEHDGYISRKHCLIYREGEQFFIENYSPNNVVINDRTVICRSSAKEHSGENTLILLEQSANKAEIMDNDIIRIGHTRLKFNVIEDNHNGNKL